MQPEKIKILLIEDDYFLSGIYLKKFELEGFEIIAARNGDEGLSFAKSKKPDIILLDILLPRQDGFNVLKGLKEDSATKSIPVLIISNLSEEENIRKAFGLGAVDYLIKSNFLPSEVIDKVKKALTKKPRNLEMARN